MMDVSGYSVVRASERDPLPDLLEAFHQSGSWITRDVVIGGMADAPHLVSMSGDFWFHTDGVFWTIPPHWIIIQVLQTEGGGQLEVVDAGPLLEEFPRGECFFGREGIGQTAALVSYCDENPVLRYREDYMIPISGGLDLNALHSQLKNRLFPSSIDLGCLQPGECLVLNNWTHLHRRRAFSGNRRIRRIWLDGQP
jgi:alpha-ketoglutarate-dependent taurine dioxygenase